MTVGDFGSELEKLERLDRELTSDGLVLVEYNSQAKPSEPDRAAFDRQHICMNLHRRNGLRRQPAAISVHMLISCVLTPRCEPPPQLKYLHITLDSFERADQTTIKSFQLQCFKQMLPQGNSQHGTVSPSVSLFIPFPSSLRLARFYL